MKNLLCALVFIFSTASLAQELPSSAPFPLEAELQGAYQKEWDKVTIYLVPAGPLTYPEFSYTAKADSIRGQSGLSMNETTQKMRALYQQENPSLSARLKVMLDSGKRYDLDYPSGGHRYIPSADQAVESTRNIFFGDGPICGRAHSNIVLDAYAQGFQNGGLILMPWNRGEDYGVDESHVSAYYQDPVSKRYFAQIYGTILDLNTSNYREMVERTLAFHSVLTMNAFVESREGVVQQYQDNRARWVLREIENLAQSKKIGLHGAIKLSNLQESFNAVYGLKLGEAGIGNAFIGRSTFHSANGDHTLTQVGVALNLEHTEKFAESVVQEIYLSAKTFLALAHYANPRLTAGPKNGDEWERLLLEWGLDLTGKIKVGPFTLGGHWYSRMDLLDVFKYVSDKNPHYFEFLAESETPVPMVSIDYAKRLQVVSKSLVDDTKMRVSSVFDYVGLIIDTRKIYPDSPVFVVNRTGLYMLGGLEEYAGSALGGSLQLVWRMWQRLEVSARAQYSFIMQNRYSDPLYGSPGDTSCELALGLKCKITDHFDLSFSGGHRTGTQGLFFQNDLNQRPDLSTGQENLFVQAELTFHWGSASKPGREELYTHTLPAVPGAQGRTELTQVKLPWQRGEHYGQMEIHYRPESGRFVYGVTQREWNGQSWAVKAARAIAERAQLLIFLERELKGTELTWQNEQVPSSAEIISTLLADLK